MKKLNDFGEKIGGAKKDLWALFNSLSNEEQGEMAQKTKLWKRPDYRAMVQEGTPKEVCFWQCQMRKAVVSRPKMDATTYVKFVIEFKADVEACNSIDDIKAFYAGYPEETERDGVFKYLIKASSDPDDKSSSLCVPTKVHNDRVYDFRIPGRKCRKRKCQIQHHRSCCRKYQIRTTQ